MPEEETTPPKEEKKKAAPKKVEQSVVEPVVEPVIEPPKEEKKTKTIEQVECPKCHKMMSKRTLRYDHPKTCPGEKVDREKIPVKKRIKKVESPSDSRYLREVESKPEPVKTTINIPEEIIEQEVKKRIQNTVNDRIQQRIKQKEEKIKKLSAHIA